MRKVLFLDRDGVINQDSFHYIKSPDEFIFIPGSCEAIARLVQAGYEIGVATNQSGIARGYYDVDMLSRIHEKMLKEIRQCGGDIHAIVFCPHHPHQGCSCRKPNPGMLYQLGKLLHCKLAGVPFIGDRFSDIQAAQAAGMQPILIQSIMTEPFLLAPDSPYPTYASLFDAMEALLACKT